MTGSTTSTDYGIGTTLDVPFADAVPRVREALSEQGFGVLTEIDVTATMQEKLGETMEDFVILGACNPPLAHRALTAERSIGLLLPCNVVVRADGDRSVVEAMDPTVMSRLTSTPEIAAVAEEAGQRLRAALDALSGAAGG